jgi:hypothetical protein
MLERVAAHPSGWPDSKLGKILRVVHLLRLVQFLLFRKYLSSADLLLRSSSEINSESAFSPDDLFATRQEIWSLSSVASNGRFRVV